MKDYPYFSELIINTSSKRFDQWLRQYTPSNITNYVELENGKIINLVKPIIIREQINKYTKILGHPHLEKSAENIKTFGITIGEGDLSEIHDEKFSLIDEKLSLYDVELLSIFEPIG